MARCLERYDSIFSSWAHARAATGLKQNADADIFRSRFHRPSFECRHAVLELRDFDAPWSGHAAVMRDMPRDETFATFQLHSPRRCERWLAAVIS